MDPTWLVRGLLGGLLIGLSASSLLLLNGKIAGITGIVSGSIVPETGNWLWKVEFVAGLLIGGVALQLMGAQAFGAAPERTLPLMLVAGVLVGIGTRMANGCTSGHGICGNARLSPRSIAATGVFMVTGVLAVFLFAALGGGRP